MNKLSLAFLAISLVFVAACDAQPFPIKIKAATPVSSLPPLPQRSVVKVESYQQVFEQAKDVKTQIDELGGQIDIGVHGELDCQLYFDLYQQAAALPILEAPESDTLLIWAADEYNSAIDHILETARDTYCHCEAFLLGESTTTAEWPKSYQIQRST
jgi:hypothetical protein